MPTTLNESIEALETSIDNSLKETQSISSQINQLQLNDTPILPMDPENHGASGVGTTDAVANDWLALEHASTTDATEI